MTSRVPADQHGKPGRPRAIVDAVKIGPWWMPRALVAALRARAVADGVTLSEGVRRAVAAWVAGPRHGGE